MQSADASTERIDPDATMLDPLVEAETLRTHLAEAAASVSRLIVQLKAGRKEKKVLATVWSNLKALNLGSGGLP